MDNRSPQHPNPNPNPNPNLNPNPNANSNHNTQREAIQQDNQPSKFSSASEQPGITPQSAPVFPNSIARPLTGDWNDVHNAISPLPEKDVYKFSRLIEALKKISKNQSSRQTTKILNHVDKYLNRWLTNFNTNDLESLQEEPVEWLQKTYKWLQQGFEIHTEINDLNPDQKKELLALGYFLQGKLSTEEEFEYIRKILRSYLAKIEQFRSSPPPQ